MPTPPPRKFFVSQIHLSTTIVMMFVAGGLIWANLEPEKGILILLPGHYTPPIKLINFKVVYLRSREELDAVADGLGIELVTTLSDGIGWPFRNKQTIHFSMINTKEKVIYSANRQSDWNELLIFLNTCIAATILFIVWFVCEYLLRRRTAQKGA